MTPEWTSHDGRIRLINADCLSVLPSLAAGSVDAVVTDPPYGVRGAILNQHRATNGRSHNTWHAEPTWDDAINPAWCEACCVLSPVVAWFGNWKRREIVAAAMKHPIRCEVVWAKDTHVGPPCPLAMQDERVRMFSATGLKPQRFETTVWHEPIIPTWAHRHHKNEKPIALMVRLVTLLTTDLQTVCDPFAGSGTTGVACVRSGRKFIGIESDPTHFATAVARIESELTRAPLFEPAPAVQRSLLEVA